LIEAERKSIYELPHHGKIAEEGRRRTEHELDLEEAGAANLTTNGGRVGVKPSKNPNR
jgi:hypothetical protein